MNAEWKHCRKVLCVRLDNMGDVLMSSPAMEALKKSLNCSVTLLTSSMGVPIAKYLSCVDDVIVYDSPWVKSEQKSVGLNDIIHRIRVENFDAAVVFHVYSQNPLPAALILYEAGIPLRLGYCRENPYQLFTHWVPDKEPYELIDHQVVRDLKLVEAVGAINRHPLIKIKSQKKYFDDLLNKLRKIGFDPSTNWIILHPGVSEEKRKYPLPLWIEVAKQFTSCGLQVVVTGSNADKKMCNDIVENVDNAYALAGQINLGEFVCLIEHAPLVVSVNTSTIHIASAFDTPMIVPYALTNPQHAPWMSRGFLFPFTVEKHQQSKNEIIRFVNEKYFDNKFFNMPSPDEIVDAGELILNTRNLPAMPLLVGIPGENATVREEATPYI